MEIDTLDRSLDPIAEGRVERSDANQLAAELERRLASETQRIRDAALALWPLGTPPRMAEVVVAPRPQIGLALRRLAERCLVLDLDGDPWLLRADWLRDNLRTNSSWADLAKVPLADSVSVAVETLLRLLASGQHVVFWPDETVTGVLALLEAKGLARERLIKQVRIAPELTLAPATLQAWFEAGCPGSGLADCLPAMLEQGRLRWACAVYEAIFPLVLGARQQREQADPAAPCPRVIMNLLLWLRAGEDTALRVLAHARDEAVADAGLLRCSQRLGMLLAGVRWHVVAARVESIPPDTEWISYVHSTVPEVAAQLAGAGWGRRAEQGTLPSLRAETLARSPEAGLELLSRGLVTIRAGRLELGYDLLGSSGRRLWRGARPTNLENLCSSLGVDDRLREIAAARLAYVLDSTHAPRGVCGTRRNLVLTVQRSNGLAEVPPPEIILPWPERSSASCDRWTGCELSFHWAMPIERRRRSLNSAVATLDAAACGIFPPASVLLGSAACRGLIALDPDSVSFGPRGEVLAGYLWSNFAHVFQPEYSAWVRHQLQSNAASLPNLNRALLQVVTDLASVFR